jgi:choline kinase
MQTIIMAAGLGRRLGPLTDGRPQALVEVGGLALVDHALAFARAAGAEHRIVVAGLGHAELARRLEARDPDAVVVENAEYEKGSLLSYLAGRARLEPGGFLLVNADRIFSPAVVRLVARAATSTAEVILFCDRARAPGPADVKIRLEGDSIAGIGADLDAWDAGYVGITCVPAARVAAHGVAAREALDRLGESARVESALLELIASGTPAIAVDVGGGAWLAGCRCRMCDRSRSRTWRVGDGSPPRLSALQHHLGSSPVMTSGTSIA